MLFQQKAFSLTLFILSAELKCSYNFIIEGKTPNKTKYAKFK